MTRRHKIFALILGCTLVVVVILMAFLMLPSTPDLMAQATVIHDFGGPAKFDEFEWLDKSHLIARNVASTPFPSVISINIDSKSVILLPHVTHSLREVMAKFHSDELIDATPSPDGKWIMFDLLTGPIQKSIVCAIRIDDGQVVSGVEKGSSGPICWLSNSHGWVEVQENDLFVHALAGAAENRIIPTTGLYDKFIRNGDFRQLDPVLGKERVFAAKVCRSGKTLDEDGVVSPDGKRIAWLYESAWPKEIPVKIRPLLIACRYRPRLHGEVWTTRIDGTDRHEIGAFNDQSPFPVDEGSFDWTPDGRALIFSRGGVLYSVPVPETSSR